jgi:hypothetical protein
LAAKSIISFKNKHPPLAVLFFKNTYIAHVLWLC